MMRILAVVVSAALVGLMGCSTVANNPTATQAGKFTLSVTTAHGTVALSPAGGTYDSGTVVTLTPTAATGYTFGGWSGDLSGTTSPATITMNSNKIVTALFTALGGGIHGTISSDTIWNNPTNDYHIDGDLTINANVTWGRKIKVRIDDGVTVSMGTNGKLTVLEGVATTMGTGSYFEVGYTGSGTFIAQGSDSLPIFFTKGAGVANWGSSDGGFVLYDGTTSLTAFNHCIIEYATTGIDVGKNPLSITNCTIRNNQKYGINFESPAAPKDSASFVHDSIYGNGNYPITIDAEGLTKLSGDTYIHGNNTSNTGKQDGILVPGGTVTLSGTWKKHGVPYIVTKEISIGVSTGVNVTINPGVTCKFDQDAFVTVGYNGTATLIANGTALDSIRFGKTEVGNFWGSNNGGFVLYDGTTTNTSFKYCVIDSATVGIDVSDKVKLTISNCAIYNNQNSGVLFESTGSPKDSSSFVDNKITGNGKYAIEISASQLGKLSGTGTVAGNTAGGIYVTGDAVEANAIWKKHDAPYLVDGEVSIGATAGASVTVRPGAKFELVQEAFFTIGYNGTGAIIANGTAADPISFTCHIAGAYWGSTGTSGAGFNFYQDAASTSSLTYCLIAQATEGIWDDASVTIDHCTIRDNKTYGLEYGTHGDTTKVSSVTNTFLNNGTADILPAN